MTYHILIYTKFIRSFYKYRILNGYHKTGMKFNIADDWLIVSSLTG